MTDPETKLDQLKPYPLGDPHGEAMVNEAVDDASDPGSLTWDDGFAMARVGGGVLLVIGSAGATYAGTQLVRKGLAAMPASLSSHIQEALRTALPTQAATS